MKKPPTLAGFQQVENDLRELRRKIEDGSDPKASPKAAALFCFDTIMRLRSYWDRFDDAILCELCSPTLPFEKNANRMRKAIPIFRRLCSLLTGQIDGLLKAVGGPDAIAAQALLEFVGTDPNRQQLALQFLSTHAEIAKAAHRKRKSA